MLAGMINVVGYPGGKTHIPTPAPIDMQPRTQSGTLINRIDEMVLIQIR